MGQTEGLTNHLVAEAQNHAAGFYNLTASQHGTNSSYSSSPPEFAREPGICPALALPCPGMSRRSLRLLTATAHYGDDSLLESPLTHRAPYSAGGSSRTESKTQRGWRSVSGSGSLLHTPRKPQPAPSDSLHSVAPSDASLLSSMFEESAIQDHTLVNSFWGLDEDIDGDDTVIIADNRATVTSADIQSTHTQTSMLNGSSCRERPSRPACGDMPTSYASSGSSSSATPAPTTAPPSTSQPTTVYCREKGRRHETGYLLALCEAGVRWGRAGATALLCVFTLLAQSVLWKTWKEGKGMLWALWHSSAASVMSAATCVARALGLGGAGRGPHSRPNGGVGGRMNVKQQEDSINQNDSLCDDCKRKQQLETHKASAQRSWAQLLGGALLIFVAFAGYCLVNAGQMVLSAGWAVTKKTLSSLRFAATSPAEAASGVYLWLGSAWHQLVALVSRLNVFILTRCLPNLPRILLCLLSVLIFMAVWNSGTSSVWSLLPAAAPPEGIPDPSLDPSLDPNPDPSPDPSLDPADSTVEETLQASTAQSHAAAQDSEPADSDRLERLEQSLAALWERVARAGGRQERQHRQLLGLYSVLRQELARQPAPPDVDPADEAQLDAAPPGTAQWLSELLEEKLGSLREEMTQEAQNTQQQQERYVTEQREHDSRLGQVEALLSSLALRTEDVQRRQETAATPPPDTASIPMDVPAEAALLAEVQRLEEALASIRADLQGVMESQGKCEDLDGLQETVSAQVHQELQAALSGSEGAEGAEGAEGVEPPAWLEQWLSAHFVRGADLHATLRDLEDGILGNVSCQLEDGQERPCLERVPESAPHSAEEAGMSEEDVQQIVQNALRLYSEDRTGLVDYALESGGGSILSTRCSETFETKTALMSLFGLPLWYFSQSPRVVIQPDVHPGNCWAFKGTSGYLVIRLSMRVVPTAFSMEHVSKSLSPTGNITSAPRDFSVYGLEDEEPEGGQLLGSYTYQEDGDSLQTYPATENAVKAFQVIELRVLSNWGHPEYTCLYRFRVHGQPEEQ